MIQDMSEPTRAKQTLRYQQNLQPKTDDGAQPMRHLHVQRLRWRLFQLFPVAKPNPFPGIVWKRKQKHFRR